MAARINVKNLNLNMFLLIALSLPFFATSQSNCNPDDTMDNAKVTIINNITKIGVSSLDVLVTSITSECHTCDLQNTTTVIYNTSCTILLDSRWPMRLAITGINTMYNTTESCGEESLSTHFQQYGKYNIYVALVKDSIMCKGPFLMNMPSDANIPIYVMLGVFVFAAVLFVFGMRCYRGQLFSQLLMQSGNEHLIDPSNYASQDLGSMQTNINPADTPENKKPQKERLKSLDTFRGISIIVMIFCNYGGGKYWFFKHSKWNGLTVADLVFPWFVFIMGTSMAYSYTGLLRSKTPKYKIFWKIFKRSCILFLLGLVINSGGCQAVELDKLRIPGVLQRFAGTYLVTATVHMFFAKLRDPDAPIPTNPFRDITDYMVEWIINLVFIGLYCGLTFGLEVPGCPQGYLGPGGLADHGQYFNCTGGAAGYIDRMIFGSEHIYQTPTCQDVYNNTIAYDPEGLLGTLTSCVMCFLGLQAGKILMTYRNRRQRVKRFLIWGFVLCLLAGILCKFSKDDGWMPLCKNLWSVSFIFCTAGFAFILLSFCYLTIDEYKIWNGAPFYYPGMNSILLYMGHEIFRNSFPFNWSVRTEHNDLLLMDLYGTIIWVAMAVYLYQKDLFFVI